MRTRLIVTAVGVAAVGLAAFGVFTAFATVSSTTLKPDAVAGKSESVLCATCHGSDGMSVATNIPNLAGQHYEYLMQQLIAYKDGTRKNGVMTEMVRPMPLTELRNVAAYFSTIRVDVNTDKVKK
ncbi:MAG: c-type cytochrome [Gallionella sp.]|jgi:cytochrome c553|nr:c-type cytochrome [Gallionella sp.]